MPTEIFILTILIKNPFSWQKPISHEKSKIFIILPENKETGQKWRKQWRYSLIYLKFILKVYKIDILLHRNNKTKINEKILLFYKICIMLLKCNCTDTNNIMCNILTRPHFNHSLSDEISLINYLMKPYYNYLLTMRNSK